MNIGFLGDFGIMILINRVLVMLALAYTIPSQFASLKKNNIFADDIVFS
jgi:hypothetical protein